MNFLAEETEVALPGPMLDKMRPNVEPSPVGTGIRSANPL
jgi:hypothetical protein